jgi:hypothetical protein
MRFEAKKKALAAAAKVVRSMTEALAATGSAAEALHVIAEGKTVKLRTVAGGQIVESVLSDDIVVMEAGSAPVDAAALTNALSVSGDTFKVSLDGRHLDFACGRAKGRMEVKAASDDTQDDALAAAPKPTIPAPGFKALLNAITLRGSTKNAERTFHFDAKAKTLRGEATDSFRGITVVTPLNAKLPGSISLSLPAKAMDSLGFLIDDCLIGFDEKFFSIKSPGLFVSLPQSTAPAVDIAGQLKDWLGSQSKKAEFVTSIKEIKEAIADALAISTDKSGSRLTVSLGPNGGKMLGEGDAGKVETDFSVDETEATLVYNAQIVPSFLRECLDFYSNFPTVKVTVYNQALVLGLVENTDLLSSQTTAIPLLAEVTEEAPAKAKKAAPQKQEAKKPAPPADDEEEEAPKPKAKKKVPAPPVDDEEDEPKAKKAPPVDEEEAPPPPKKKAAVAVVDEEDEDEDEDFDDEE